MASRMRSIPCMYICDAEGVLKLSDPRFSNERRPKLSSTDNVIIAGLKKISCPGVMVIVAALAGWIKLSGEEEL